MKAITLFQPWATLVALGEKTYETRSWKTNYRGELAIHSSKRFSRENQLICFRKYFYEVLHDHLGFSMEPNKRLWLGYFVAVCELIDCIPVEKIRSSLSFQELAFGDYSNGRFAWQLKLTKLLNKPIPARGALGLWEWTAVVWEWDAK